MVAADACKYDRRTTIAITATQAARMTIQKGRVMRRGHGPKIARIFRYAYRSIRRWYAGQGLRSFGGSSRGPAEYFERHAVGAGHRLLTRSPDRRACVGVGHDGVGAG